MLIPAMRAFYLQKLVDLEGENKTLEQYLDQFKPILSIILSQRNNEYYSSLSSILSHKNEIK
jgi:hypothetical protein